MLTHMKEHNLFHTPTPLCFPTYSRLQKCWVDPNAESHFCTLNCVFHSGFSQFLETINMYNVRYFHMIPWMKPKIEVSSLVIEATGICSWKSLESLIEDTIYLVFKK